MRKLIVIFLLPVAISNAAITAATVFEARTTGTATSGGGFDSTIANAGTDMSIFDNKNATSCTSCQSATVNISKTDAVTNNTTTVTSASANFSSALIGNTVYLSGTGTTTGWYQCTAVGSSTSITVDRATGSTGGTGVTINIGGAGNSPFIWNANLVAGNTIWIKATAAYTYSSSNSPTAAGSSGLPIRYIGYTSSRGDNGQATIQASATSMVLINQPGSLSQWYNLIVDCNGQASTQGMVMGNNNNLVQHVKVSGCKTVGINNGGVQNVYQDVLITGQTTATTAAFTASSGTTIAMGLRITGGGVRGLDVTAGSFIGTNVLIDNNTGATTDGVDVGNTAGSLAFRCNYCVFYTNGRDGVRVTSAAGLDALSITNSVFVSNVGTGFNSTTTTWTAGLNADYNAFYNNGTARAGVPAGAHDVTLTADPFTNGASNDFSPNSTSGGGTAIKSAGWPGALQSGGTGYAPIGALVPQCSAAATPVCSISH